MKKNCEILVDLFLIWFLLSRVEHFFVKCCVMLISDALPEINIISR